jgi:hypothetical protein
MSVSMARNARGPLPHRGRWQAQGAGVEASKPWAQADPLLSADGRLPLTALENGLAPGEKAARAGAFVRANQYIDRCEQAGGVAATVIRSFPVANDTDGRCIDLEVKAGMAFVP